MAVGIRTAFPEIREAVSRSGVRERLSELVRRVYPPDESALARGMLFGDGSGISEEWNIRYRESGLSHLVVASGGNIAILAGMLSIFVKRLPAFPGSLLLLASVWGYAALAGF